jgi:hypothetical protein
LAARTCHSATPIPTTSSSATCNAAIGSGPSM